MKKEEEEKRNTRFRIKGKESVFFFERKFFPDISPTDLIKNFGNEKKKRRIVHVERMEKSVAKGEKNRSIINVPYDF